MVEVTQTKFMVPEKILREAGLVSKMRAVDLGCGAGFFTIPTSLLVGNKGRVYAIDNNEEMLSLTVRKAAFRDMYNIEKVLLDLENIEDLKLPSKVDLAILGNILYMIKSRKKVIKKTADLLKESGKLLVVDWEKVETPFGPPIEVRLSEDEIIKICEKTRFKLEKKLEAGLYHYALLFSLNLGDK